MHVKCEQNGRTAASGACCLKAKKVRSLSSTTRCAQVTQKLLLLLLLLRRAELTEKIDLARASGNSCGR